MTGPLAAALAAGVAAGLASAAPVGPVNLMAFSAAVTSGRRAALAVGAGALAADLAVASAALWGLSRATGPAAYGWLAGLAGALLLLAIGAGMIRKARRPAPETAIAGRRGAGFLSALALTLANPGTLAGVPALVAAAATAAGDAAGPATRTALLAGFAIGGALWWTGLAEAGARLGGRLGRVWLARLAAGTGLLLVAAGAAMLALIVTGESG